jgi:hypothetical protein
MYRSSGIFAIVICLLLVLGCGGIVGKLVSKQEWSENYALMDGVRATSPEMIDGRTRTFGETTFPEGTQGVYGMSPASEAIVTLPERKVIRRIVIHAPNLKEFDVFVDKGNDDWEIIKEVNSVKSKPIDLSIIAPFPTDRIRVRVLGTTDDAQIQRRRSSQGGGRFFQRGGRRAPARIHEIELYGFKSVEEVGVQSAEEEHEEELDDLLDLK